MVIYILHDCVILLESPLIWKKIERFLTSRSSLYCTLCCSMSLWTTLAHYNTSGVEYHYGNSMQQRLPKNGQIFFLKKVSLLSLKRMQG